MNELEALTCFSASYCEAREKFLKTCADRSLSVDSRLNPNARGVRGQELFTDIVEIGPSFASKTLLLISGTHGVEGYCGSGAQIGLLRSGIFDNLPSDLKIVMVHAINPYGFSHDRRVTEDNVDLNRNFLDFSVSERPESDYALIHDCILPSDWDGPARQEADAALATFVSEHGMPVFQAAVSSGQYGHPNGIFYGGAKPTWSNATIRAIISDYASNAEQLGIVDFHTGLGPYGYGELITIGTEAQKERAVLWYGDEVTDPEAGTSTSAALDGMMAHGIAETLPEAEITFITIEFGTRDILEVLTALRGDNWLYQKYNFESPLKPQIKRDIRQAFYPEKDDWKLSVWDRSQEVITKAMHGLM